MNDLHDLISYADECLFMKKSVPVYLHVFFYIALYIAIVSTQNLSGRQFESSHSPILPGLHIQNVEIISLHLNSNPLIKNLYNPFHEIYYKPIYFSIRNTGNKIAKPAIQVNGKYWYSLEGLLRDALPESSNYSEEEKIVALTRFLSRNAVWSDPPADNREISNPINFLNLYGYGWCSMFAYSLAVLSEQIGIESRVVFLNFNSDIEEFRQHVVTEVYYDGNWHMFDPTTGLFFRDTYGNIANSQYMYEHHMPIENNPLLANNQYIKDFYLYVFSEYRGVEYDYKDEFINDKTPALITYQLNPGEEIRFYYNWRGQWFWSMSAFEPPVYTNGLLISPVNLNGSDEEIIRKVELPYTIIRSYITGKNICNNVNNIYFSTDNKTWISAQGYCKDDTISFNSLFPNGLAASRETTYFIKFNNTLKTHLNNYILYTQFHVAINSIPRLYQGFNTVESLHSDSNSLELFFAFTKSENSL